MCDHKNIIGKSMDGNYRMYYVWNMNPGQKIEIRTELIEFFFCKKFWIQMEGKKIN